MSDMSVPMTKFSQEIVFTSRLQSTITIDTILGIGTDHLNIYLNSQALNGIGTVLFRGQWGKDLTQHMLDIILCTSKF